MAINKKLIHFNTKANFITKKLSANVNDTQYYTYNADGSTTTVTTGAPDIKYSSIVFIKDTKEIWTHGQLYAGITKSEVKDLVDQLRGQFSTIHNEIDIIDAKAGANTTAIQDLTTKTDTLETNYNTLDAFTDNLDSDLAIHTSNTKIHVPAATTDDLVLFSKADGSTEWKNITEEQNIADITTQVVNTADNLESHVCDLRIHVNPAIVAGQYLVSTISSGDPSIAPEWKDLTDDQTIIDLGDAISELDTDLQNHKINSDTGLKHIPSGGSSGNILSWSSTGVAQWQNPINVIPDATVLQAGLMTSNDKVMFNRMSSAFTLEEMNNLKNVGSSILSVAYFLIIESSNYPSTTGPNILGRCYNLGNKFLIEGAIELNSQSNLVKSNFYNHIKGNVVNGMRVSYVETMHDPSDILIFNITDSSVTVKNSLNQAINLDNIGNSLIGRIVKIPIIDQYPAGELQGTGTVVSKNYSTLTIIIQGLIITFDYKSLIDFSIVDLISFKKIK